MSAGQPNWLELHRMGKLPKHARHLIPGLIDMDTVTSQLKLALKIMTKEQRAEFKEKVKTLEIQAYDNIEEVAPKQEAVAPIEPEAQIQE